MKHRGLWKLVPALVLALAWVVFPATHSTHAASTYTVSSVPYNWEEISGTGTRVTAINNTDDGLSECAQHRVLVSVLRSDVQPVL